MHAGFADLRTNMPMNIRASYPGKGMTPAVRADIERITGSGATAASASPAPPPRTTVSCSARFSAADAMYAPVVTRFAPTA